MSSSSIPFGTIAVGQGDQVTKANALFDALFAAALYAKKYETTTGLTLGLHGGNLAAGGALLVVSDLTVSLTLSATNYVEAHPDTGAVTKNTTSYTPGYLRIGVAVCGASSITSWTDDRYLRFLSGGTLTKTLPSDAAYTLTASEADNSVLEISGTLTATRNITIPLVGKRQYTVYNGTGQSLQFIGPSGTGITVATLKHAIVRSDGTNIVRVTADT